MKRRDLNVVSFKQAAVEEFHRLRPAFDLAPGIDGAAGWLLGGKSPGAGVRIFQLPVTYTLNGTRLAITTADNVARAHRDGFAWQNWFSDQDSDGPRDVADAHPGLRRRRDDLQAGGLPQGPARDAQPGVVRGAPALALNLVNGPIREAGAADRPEGGRCLGAARSRLARVNSLADCGH